MDSFSPLIIATAIVQWSLFALCLEPDWNGDLSSSTSINSLTVSLQLVMASTQRLSASGYLKAIERARNGHEFSFLDLPKPVRRLIYTFLFSDPSFAVCTFVKDRSLSSRSPWPATARSQILSCSRAIYAEAAPLLYNITNFSFSSAASLRYFTWYDVASSKLNFVAKITVTNLPSLSEVRSISHRLPNLKRLVIDLSPNRDETVFARFSPLEVGLQATFARRVLRSAFYRTIIHKQLAEGIPPTCRVFFVVMLVLDPTVAPVIREMIAIDVDSKAVVRNFCAVVPDEPKIYYQLPSAEDDYVVR